MPEIKLLVNIDESSFSNSTKKNYSWLEKGKSCALNNIVFQNSINVISCITSNGLSINLFKYISSTAKIFISFLKYLFKYLKEEEGIKPEEVGIILDNCAIHRAHIVKYY